jgi:hypothetical protein
MFKVSKLFKSLMQFGLFFADGDEGGGGAATVSPEVQAQIDAAVAAAIGGLKTKNSELLGKLKDAGTNLQRFDGIDPDAVRNILSKFASEEEAGLIAKGDIEAVMKKRHERMQIDHEKTIKGRDDAIAQLNSKAAKLAAGKVSGALTQAASKTGALPEAMEDIVLRGQGQGWTINDDGDVVAMRDGEVVLGKDGKTALSPQEWAESLRESAPHLWPKAQGSGAQGSGATGPRTLNAGNLGGSKSDRVAALAARFPELK